MRLSSTHLRRRSPSDLARACRVAALALLVSLVPACVTRGTHDRALAQLESARNRVRDLERSNEALGGERIKLLEEMEDLRVTREELASDVAELQKTRDLLSTNLREREEKLAELSKLSGSYEQLVTDLESEVAKGQIQIEQLREGLRLNLSQDILFRSGAVTLEPYGVSVLKKVSGQLGKIPEFVEVQGHSDNVPLSTSLAKRWGSNWELAAARAAQVVRLFEAEGVDPKHLRAVSYGPFAPVADNETPEGRARNRRIEIRLIPIDVSGEAPTPGTAAPGPEAEAAPAPGA